MAEPVCIRLDPWDEQIVRSLAKSFRGLGWGSLNEAVAAQRDRHSRIFVVEGLAVPFAFPERLDP